MDQLFVCYVVKAINQGCSHIFSSPELFGYPVARGKNLESYLAVKYLKSQFKTRNFFVCDSQQKLKLWMSREGILRQLL